jgi:8-oxo-dGTP pyrophosphatase MutT (NUDIX family)
MREERDKVWRPLATATVGASTAVREVPFTEAASAALLLLDRDPPRVLLGLRTRSQGRRYPGTWDAIGGKPDEGETLLEALSREACEEAGVEPLDLTALGCFHDGERADAYFLATTWKGRPRNLDPSTASWAGSPCTRPPSVRSPRPPGRRWPAWRPCWRRSNDCTLPADVR